MKIVQQIAWSMSWLLLSGGAIAPSLAVPVPTTKINTQEVNFTLTLPQAQTFSALMQRAEEQAATLVQQTFTKYPAAKEVTVRILGERNGQEVPLLFLTVSRANWQKSPQINLWARSFSYSEILLGFRKPGNPSAASVASASASQSSANLAEIARAEAIKDHPAYRDD